MKCQLLFPRKNKKKYHHCCQLNLPIAWLVLKKLYTKVVGVPAGAQKWSYDKLKYKAIYSVYISADSFLTLSALKIKSDICANNVDPNEMAHCLPFCFAILF